MLNLVIVVVLFCLQAVNLTAEDFSIQIASPVAAQTYNMKSSAFVFRTIGCQAPGKPEVAASAEGIVFGQRRSIPIKVQAAQTPGVFGIFRQWPDEGVWIVNLSGSCGVRSASVLVSTDAKGFIRHSSIFLPRHAAESDIQAALKAPRKKADSAND
jgi:hypothetical protein